MSLGVHVTDQRRYPDGVPCWVDTAQPDLDSAGHFYSTLFGWALTDAMPVDVPGHYLIATLDGHDVAAIGPTTEGESACWHTFVACDDVDATAARVLEAGGEVLESPSDVGPPGRTATVADPAGASFHLWQAGRRLGAQLVNVPNAWNFNELHTPDLAAVLPFYASTFGWQVDPDLGAGMIRLPGYGDHLAATVDPHIFERQAFAPRGFADVVAGLATGEPARWAVRFAVADRDDSVALAERLGATVLRSSETEWTREATVRDPQGAELVLSQFLAPS